MTNRSQGRQKSNFPGSTALPSGATLDFVSNGANFKITVADFLAALDVTGSIVQAGDPEAVPVLDTQGDVHQIRNIETADGSGLRASVSAENGITLVLDAHAEGTGTPVLNSANKVRRLLAGAGMTIVLDGDDIVVSATGASTIEAGLTAFAGGGQADATELTKELNQVGTCATAGDSVKLPTAVAGLRVTVINNGAENMGLFPASGDFIGQNAVDTAISLGVNTTAELVAYDSSHWEIV